MLNGDWLTPLAAGVMCRENQLPQDRSLAVTAAALVLNGPLALAPALVAVERKRRADAIAAAASDGAPAPAAASDGAPAKGPADPPAPGVPPVEQARPLVPDLIGKFDGDGADAEIRRFNLVPQRHRSWDDSATENLVFAQSPMAGPNVRVPEGTVIDYYLSAGPKPLAPDKPGDDDAAIAKLQKDIDGRLVSLDTKIDGRLVSLEAKIDALIRAQNPDAPPLGISTGTPPPPGSGAATGGTGTGPGAKGSRASTGSQTDQ